MVVVLSICPVTVELTKSISKIWLRTGTTSFELGVTVISILLDVAPLIFDIEATFKELIVICDVGAYGMSLSSNYNLRPKPIELLIDKSKVKVINKRQDLRDLI